MLPEIIGPTWSEFNFEFTSNGEALVYSKLSTNDPSSNDLLKNTKAIIHYIGTNSENDKIIASIKKYPELNILPEQFPEVYFSADYKYAFLQLESTKIEILVYYIPLSGLKNERIDWKPLITLEDEITGYYTFGNQLYFLTHKNAPNYKIGVTTIGNTDFLNAKIIVPEGKMLFYLIVLISLKITLVYHYTPNKKPVIKPA